MQAEGDQRLLEAPQEVLEHPAHHVDVGHVAQAGQCAAGTQQPLLPLPHQRLGARHPVQPCLGAQRGSAPWGAQPHHAPLLSPPRPLPRPSRASPPRSHSAPPVPAPAGVSGAQSQPGHPGEDKVRGGQCWTHTAPVPSPTSCPSPRGPRAALTSRGQACWRARGPQGPGQHGRHLACSSSWQRRHFRAAFPKRRREPQAPQGSGRMTWQGGIWSASPCIPPACPGVRGGEEARTVLEVNWCWGCRRLGGGEVKGAGAGCPTEPPSVWLSCPGARPPESSLVPHAVAGSAERGGSGGDPIGRGPQSHHSGSKHSPADIFPPP